MNWHTLTIALLASCISVGTLAEAKPQSKAKQTKTGIQASASASAPEHHTAAYKRFKAILEKQTKENIYDPCPAFHEILQATNDEFAADSWMKKAADEGCAAALYFHSVKELNVVPANLKQHPKVKAAVLSLKKASDKKYAPAMVDYAACLRNGVGCLKNESMADKILMEACRSKHIEPRYSWLLQTNRLSKYEDIQRSEVVSEIERGNHCVLYHLCNKAPDTFKKLTMLTQAARLGSSAAMYDLSLLISHINVQSAYYYLKMAAAYHEPRALQKMGEYLISARKEIADQLGMHKDEAAGTYLLKLATMIGNNDARLYMAKLYSEGLCGVPMSPEKAYQHLYNGTLAYPSAELLAAQAYMLITGNGVEKNETEGLEMLKASVKVAASSRNPHPSILLAYVYYKGLCGADESMGRDAIYTLKDLALRGIPDCFVYLALIYQTGGNGVAKNEKEARYYLDHAKRSMGDKAEQLFNEQLEKYGEWHLLPINIVL